jgi:hypothetical protein
MARMTNNAKIRPKKYFQSKASTDESGCEFSTYPDTPFCETSMKSNSNKQPKTKFAKKKNTKALTISNWKT